MAGFGLTPDKVRAITIEPTNDNAWPLEIRRSDNGALLLVQGDDIVLIDAEDVPALFDALSFLRVRAHEGTAADGTNE